MFLIQTNRIKGEGNLEPETTPIADEMEILEPDIPKVNNNEGKHEKIIDSFPQHCPQVM